MPKTGGNPYISGGETKGSVKLPGKGTKVVVAMSGGVDSSVAALLLQQQGFEVIGVALQTTDYSKYGAGDSGGTCCSVKDMEDARRVAEAIGIPFYVLNTEKTFDSVVVNYFVNEYLQGRTPNPCIMCNTKVKFNHLYKKAMDMGADFVATGHYAKVTSEPGLGYCLWKSTDTEKDQTYFLFNLTQSQLERTMFPIGHLKKPQVRKIAADHHLPVAEKPDSQEICFVPGNDYAKFIRSKTPEKLRRPGYITSKKEVVLGKHDGIFNYTIGQRKGLGDAVGQARAMGLEESEPLYVTKLDPARALVIMGPESDLMKWGLSVTGAHWIVPPQLQTSRRVTVKIRHRAEVADAEIRSFGDNRIEVRFTAAQRAVTPGQACVFYEGNLCLGGGWISEAINVPVENRPSKTEELTAGA